MRWIVTLLILSGCATWEPTPQQRVVFKIEGELRSCLASTCNRTFFEQRLCYKNEERECAEAGLEKHCGTADILTNPPKYTPLGSCSSGY